MPLPFRVMVVTDWSLGPKVLLARVEAALQAGPGLAVQHRHPGQTAREFLEEGRTLAALCARFDAPLFVNGRLDVALALQAHLHLPAHAIPVAEARPHLPGRWISAAVHSEAEAGDAAGADLALLSPVFAPGSKPTDTRPPLGAEGFHRLAARLSCPAFALGGLTPERAQALGPLAGVAVVSAVLGADDARRAAAGFLQALR
jgi:thiamine-phosphate pyrophosphorylase